MTKQQVRALQEVINAGGQIQLDCWKKRVGAYTEYTTGTYAVAETKELADLADMLLAKDELLSFKTAT